MDEKYKPLVLKLKMFGFTQGQNETTLVYEKDSITVNTHLPLTNTLSVMYRSKSDYTGFTKHYPLNIGLDLIFESILEEIHRLYKATELRNEIISRPSMYKIGLDTFKQSLSVEEIEQNIVKYFENNPYPHDNE